MPDPANLLDPGLREPHLAHRLVISFLALPLLALP